MPWLRGKGRLWPCPPLAASSPPTNAHLGTARLPNNASMAVFCHLGWRPERIDRVPVNWRAMETKEPGSVYEALLHLQRQLADNGRSLVFAAEVSEQKGNQHQTTGSCYTADSGSGVAGQRP